MPITKEVYGKTDDDREIFRYTLTNGNNYEVRIITFGGIITNIFAPDKDGKLSDVVFGFDSLDRYKVKHPYFGALIGRYGNRIAGAKFTLDGTTYNLAANNKDVNALHGGNEGFDKRVWESEIQGDKLVLAYISADGEDGYLGEVTAFVSYQLTVWESDIQGDKLVLAYISADGEEGYPGEVNASVSYQLTSDNKLIINYSAMTSKPTIINMTNHSYFNLAGHESGTIGDHTLKINARHYLPVDDTLIPLGHLEPVTGTPFDLTKDTELGSRLGEVPGGFGFDHNFCLGEAGTMKHVARLFHPTSRRFMNMYSTEPGVQCYTGSNLDGLAGKAGAVYNKFASVCLEAQHYPDSPNQAEFPSVVLRPDEFYMQTTMYEFGVEK